MNTLKLIAFAGIIAALLTSCETDNDTQLSPDRSRYVSNQDFFLTGSQQIPPNASAGNGRIEGTYDRKTKTFNYTLKWTALSSNVTAIHIHGIADRGFVAIPIAPLAAYPNGIVQTAFGFATTPASGTYTGSLFVDGVVVKEHDLLASKFYIDIHTVNFPNGEIRGQIIFP